MEYLYARLKLLKEVLSNLPQKLISIDYHQVLQIRKEAQLETICFGLLTGVLLTAIRIRAQIKELRTKRKNGMRSESRKPQMENLSILEVAYKEYKNLSSGTKVKLNSKSTIPMALPVDRLNSALNGMMTSSCIYIGDKLDLYKVLHSRGSLTPVQLSKITGLNKRFLLEWLLQGAASGILELNDTGDSFSLRKGYSELLLDPRDSDSSIVANFQLCQALVQRYTEMEECFETGIGSTYDGTGKLEIAHAIERIHYKAFHEVVPEKLLGHDEICCGQLNEKLKKGGLLVADIGCGTGMLLVELARRFPMSKFHGYEISDEAIEQGKLNIKRSKLSNVDIFHASKHPMPEMYYDLCISYDLLHDCTKPSQLMNQVKASLKVKAPWIVVDIECSDNNRENIAKENAECNYAISLALCLQSSMSQLGGAGLGIFGLYPEKLSDMAREAGFSRFTHFKLAELPNNNCFVLIK